MLASGSDIGQAAAVALGAGCFPVRALLFDKSEATNWSLGWHQDRTIVVKTRRDTAGFGPWTIKQRLCHVAPPVEVLAGMVTLRVHLDSVTIDNAPLKIASGTHMLGRIQESDIPARVAGSHIVTCLANRGDIWLYSTPILHASDATAHPSRRRVFQIDYAAATLPDGLEWAGI